MSRTCEQCNGKRFVCVDWESGEWAVCPKCNGSESGHPAHNPAPADCGTHPHNDGLEDYRK